jgi:hypothetical protein
LVSVRDGEVPDLLVLVREGTNNTLSDDALLRSRRRIMLARGADLVGAGFPLLPTLDHPHWTVVMPDLLDARLAAR